MRHDLDNITTRKGKILKADFRNEPIALFVNSLVGESGNIGYRAHCILEESGMDPSFFYVVARGVSVRSLGADYTSFGPLGQVPRILNAIRIYLFRGFKHRLYDIRLFEILAGAVWYLRLRRRGIKLAHVWDSAPNIVRRLKRAGVTVIVDVPIAPNAYARSVVEAHGEKNLSYDPAVLLLENETFALADLAIAPSEFVADEIRKIQPDLPIEVVPFGVNLPATARTHDKKPGAPLKFAFAGAVNPRKGIPDLLEVWQDPRFQTAELHLLGRVFPVVQPQLHNNSNAAGIKTPGYVNTFEYLQDCDVFVFPSWMEGSAKAVYEAMAVGLPVVVTRQAGSIVRDGVDGFVIEAGDTDVLKDRMTWFLDHPEDLARMGANARDRAASQPWAKYARNVAEIYQRIGSGSAKSAENTRTGAKQSTKKPTTSFEM